ncbi:MAG: ArsR/SmtB family transcription factor [Planctomycetota bacterium]
MGKLPDKRTKRLRRIKADVFRALGHPIRVGIVEFLAGGEACVCKISEAVGAERSNVSRHLALMVRTGVLTSRREGLMVYYNLKARCVMNFLTCVENVLREQLADSTELLRSLRTRRGRAQYA